MFCCWCAQDLEANYFWQAMGFTPLAFRTGSDRKQRIHIFWQKRIRMGDEATPWWFPSTTTGGAVRADRIVLPIPPGVKWNDAMPIVLPGLEEARKALKDDRPKKARVKKGALPSAELAKGAMNGASSRESGKGLRFGPSLEEIEQQKRIEAEAEALRKKAERSSRPRRLKKVDAKYVEQARELRDRYLAAVNTPGNVHALEGSATTDGAKYEVGRALRSEVGEKVRERIGEGIGPVRLLDAA